MTLAAAEDIESVAHTRGADIGFDIDGDIAGHVAVDVGAAIDAGNGTVGGVIVDHYVAAGGGLSGGTGAFTHAAAEDRTIQVVVVDVDGGGLAGSAHRAESRAAIEVTVDGGAAEGDGDVAVGSCAVTEAAAVDHVGSGAIDTHRAAGERDGDIAGHGTAGVAAAIEAVGHGAAGKGYIASSYVGLVAAAKHFVYCAAGDVHVGRPCIVGHIAAAEDIVGIAGRDVYYHSVLRGTVEVVAAEDAVGHAAVDEYCHRAVDESRDGFIDATGGRVVESA